MAERTDISKTQFNLIFVILVAGVILSLVATAIFSMKGGWLFWLSLAGVLFYSLAAWCWLDERRIRKNEIGNIDRLVNSVAKSMQKTIGKLNSDFKFGFSEVKRRTLI